MIFEIPWYVILFQTLPETFILIKLGLKIFNIDTKTKDILVISSVISVLAYFIRKILYIVGANLLFGIHTLLITLTTVILVHKKTKTTLSHSFISIFTSTLLDGVLQSVTAPIIFTIMKKNIEDLHLYPWLNILFFLPCGIIMLIIYLVIKKKKIYLLDLKLDSKDCDNIV
ncbi:hypothetical protein [Tepidibacter aestuarii]|uniref:hypothetical protein n=1 Tax=Tepidibacter aestuarii TaxID=2925782 RepID=UPI0020C01C43|nr:hypothetical protein [Tepidibacter aestuarii]CAH2213178.1 membrane protein of unknown function [Tepidibacter aestuarii]